MVMPYYDVTKVGCKTMKKKRLRAMILPMAASLLLGLELVCLADAVTVFFGGALTSVLFAGLWMMTALAVGFAAKWRVRNLLAVVCAIPVSIAVILAPGFVCWKQFSRNAGYQLPVSERQEIYGGRNVMVIVPHQDDELNILGGVLDEYVRHGSDAHVVIVTTGDRAGKVLTRHQEAVAVCRSLGLPEDRVIFLGYGNEWKTDGPHIYNAQSGAVVESFMGRTATYAPEGFEVYHPDQEYTIDNLTGDLKSVILEHKPDVIFCSDYDHHIDHRALSLLFDKVMGQILKEEQDYKPVVYKAYAYGTAWEAVPDYYGDYVLSTQNPFEEPYCQRPTVYRWEDRTRFPVAGETLSRSLVGSGAYRQLKLYKSQGAHLMAASVVNGDKVAWRRYTDSLAICGQILASSGNAELLNDFMLVDSHDLTAGKLPYDGVWIPEDTDMERSFSVTMEQKNTVDTIVLYDHPDRTENVRNAEIWFEDGTVLQTGPLDPGGAATVISVDKENVSGFRVVLDETEGSEAGISEIEVFSRPHVQNGRFLKLTDSAGNFLYELSAGTGGETELFLYVHGDLPMMSADAYEVYSEGGTVSVSGEKILVRCPEGERIRVTVTEKASGISDSITIRNPGEGEYRWQMFWQGVEKTVYDRWSVKCYKQMQIFGISEKIAYVIRHLK